MCGVHGPWKSQPGSSLRNWCHGIDHAQEVQAFDSHLGSQGEHFLHTFAMSDGVIDLGTLRIKLE
jgi:hypothetical protein